MALPADGPSPAQPLSSPGSSVPGAEADLVARFLERLRLFATRRLGDRAAAEDLAQETIRSVIEALRAGRLEDPAALAGYVFETARHLCARHHRSAEREQRALRRLTPADERVTTTDALAGLIDEERRAAVRRALQQLPPGDQDLLRLVYFEQLDLGEIARRLALTPGAARVRKHRALERLAAALGEGGTA